MPKMNIAHAKVTLDDYTVVSRGETNPLNWAEVELLWFQHGERAVSDIVVVDTVEANNAEVLEELRIKYGAKAIAKAFPGQRPRLPLLAPDEYKRAAKNPKPRTSKAAAKVPVDEALADIVASE